MVTAIKNFIVIYVYGVWMKKNGDYVGSENRVYNGMLCRQQELVVVEAAMNQGWAKRRFYLGSS